MFEVIAKRYKFVLLSGLLIAVISGLVSLLFPMQYKAQSSILVISQDRTGVDPYTQSQAAERIGENLASVMNTTDFYNKVMQSADATFDKSKWQNLTDQKQRKNWQKDVTGEVVYGTSLMNVTVYSYNKADTFALANAVTKTLVSQGWEYVGNNVTLKAVDDPLVSTFPARPNYILIVVLGLVLGILLSSFWVMKYGKK